MENVLSTEVSETITEVASSDLFVTHGSIAYMCIVRNRCIVWTGYCKDIV